MPEHQSLEVFQLSTLAELASLRNRWNQLAAGMPMRRWEWLEAWWRVYGNAFRRPHEGTTTNELYLLCVFAPPDHLVAITPWYIEHSLNYGRTLRFLGSGEVCTDYSTILCEPGFEQTAAEAIAKTLSDPLHVADWLTQNHVRHWDRIEFDAVSRDDQLMQLLLAELERRDNLVHRRPTQNTWRLRLPQTWDDYLATLSKSHRKQIRRYQKDFFDSGRAVVRRATTEEELDHAWHLLVDLHERRRRTKGEPGCFASTQYTMFHRNVMEQLLRENALRLDWLELDGTPVAIDYCLSDDSTIYAYQGGIDPAAMEYSPGQLLLCASLQRAIAEGIQWYDFLRGNEPFKAHWRALPAAVERVRVMPRTASNRVRHGLWVASDHVKHWLKSSLKSAVCY